MKSIFLLILLAAGFGADAQTLKELLYSGKLKKDSSAVIRKTDDLSTKIDTAQKKAVVQESKPVQEIKKETPVTTDAKVQAEVKTNTNANANEVAETERETETERERETVPVTTAAPVKSNTKIWKELTDSLSISLKAEELKNKKVKKGTYFFIIEYELGTDGQVSILNVTCSPENNLLQAQVKSRLEANPPTLTPALDSNGQPKKVKRKQSFSVEKD